MKPIPMKIFYVLLFLQKLILMPSKAQDVGSLYHINPEIEQAVGKMRVTKSDTEVLQALTTIQGGSEQAAQVLLASISVLDLTQRNKILMMVFRLPLAEDGLNTTHLSLLSQLYVKSARTPPDSSINPQPRSVVNDFVIQSRLLDIIASLLNAETIRATLKHGSPLQNFLQLLEASRDSASLPATVHKVIEETIIIVKQGIKDEGSDERTESSGNKNPASEADTTPQRLRPSANQSASVTANAVNQALTPTQYLLWTLAVLAGLGVLAFVIKRKSE